MISVRGKLVWKEHLSILETCWLTEYCVKTTWIVLMVRLQQTGVVFIVFSFECVATDWTKHVTTEKN